MTKRKSNAPISEELRAALWTADTSYNVDNGMIVVDKGEQAEARWYRLDSPDFQTSLLRDYREIYDEKGAIEFLNLYGLPFELDVSNPSVIYVEQLLGAADFIRWLVELSDAVHETSAVIEKNWLRMEKVSSSWCEVTLNPRINDRFYKQCIYIADLKRVTFFDQRQPDRFYFHDKTWGSKLFGSFRDASELGSPLPFSTKEWEELGKFAPIRAAQRYLNRALDELLKHVQLAYKWVDPAAANGPVVELKLNVTCPWHAIGYALLRRMMGFSDFHRCKAPNCGKLFQRTRSDKETCSNACYMRLYRAPYKHQNKKEAQ